MSATSVTSKVIRKDDSRPSSLHHTGWVVADQEANRHFIEDLLGLPLIACFTEESGLFGGIEFCHTMYEMGDGSTLTFFQIEGGDSASLKSDPAPNFFNHVALRVSLPTQIQIHRRLLDDGYPHQIINHGWCHSLYVTAPDGLNFEMCADADVIDDAMTKRRIDPHGDLVAWLAGDHSPNDEWKPDESKPFRYVYPEEGENEPPLYAHF